MVPAIIGGAQALFGLGQQIFGGARARREQRAMQKMLDGYTPNAGILDYYSKALNRYSQNPYNSAAYQNSTQNISRNLASGLGAAQNRRGGLSSLGALVQGANNSNLQAVANAEQMQGQNLAQLGQATMMKDREDKYKFENLYNLRAMKAGAGAQIQNAGFQNMFGGLGTAADYFMTDAGQEQLRGLNKKKKK